MAGRYSPGTRLRGHDECISSYHKTDEIWFWCFAHLDTKSGCYRSYMEFDVGTGGKSEWERTSYVRSWRMVGTYCQPGRRRASQTPPSDARKHRIHSQAFHNGRSDLSR